MSRKTNTSKLPATGFIRQSQLIPVIIPFSSSTLWRKVKAGTFPAPVKLSERVTAWPVESVRAWMNSLSNQTLENQP
jgi:predicted DNA-binding transcriptional regulator AlpA